MAKPGFPVIRRVVFINSLSIEANLPISGRFFLLDRADPSQFCMIICRD